MFNKENNSSPPEFMLCPYCEKLMTGGYIESPNILVWNKKRSSGMISKEIVLSRSIGFAHIYSWYCKSCNKIIIDVPPK